MGSWNATCAITNNPVFEDEPVYVFLLQAKEKPISRCHPDFLYGLLPFHFEGKYNLDEGMMCKGFDKRQQQWMAKIKTKTYLDKLKTKYGEGWEKMI